MTAPVGLIQSLGALPPRMPRDDGLLARFDPESVSDTPPSRLVAVPRLTLGVHALVAAVFVTLALLAVTTGPLVQTVVLVALGGMVLPAGWAAGRLVARR